eukprot:gene11916-12559_t
MDPSIGKKGGPLRPEITVKIAAVSFIFFSSGLTLRTEDLKKSILQFKVHAFIQGFQLMVVPLVGMQLVKPLAMLGINPAILRGVLVVCCLPPPVSSAAILTRAAGGNEAAAIFNSAFGSFLGIFVTPPLLMKVVGVSSEVPAMDIVKSLSLTVVLPLIVGQLLRMLAWRRISAFGIPWGPTASAVLLMIIYSAFCDTFAGDVNVDQKSLLSILGIVIGMILGGSALTFYLSNFLGYAPKDVVCIMYCSTHKSLTLGMPMLKIVFADNPLLSVLCLPLLAYHPTQIMLGGLLVPTMKGWLDKADPDRRSSSSSSSSSSSRSGRSSLTRGSRSLLAANRRSTAGILGSSRARSPSSSDMVPDHLEGVVIA